MNFTTKELAQFMVANYRGEVQIPANFSADEIFSPEEAITHAFHKMLGTNENSTVEDYMLAFRKEDARLGLFAIVEEVLREGIIHESWQIPFFDRFVETKSQARGDKNVFYIESRNEVVVSRISKDGRVSLDRQRFDEGYELTVATETRGAKVYEHIVRIMTRKTGWGDFVQKLYLTMEKDIAEMCYGAFLAVVENLPNEFVHRGTYDAKKIKEKIRNVKLISNASSVTLVGTELALESLTLDQSIEYVNSEFAKKKIYNTGRLGKWYGHDVLELANGFKQGTGLQEMVMPDNTVYIIPNVEQKPVKLVVEPELVDIQNSAIARVDDTIEVAVRWTCGAQVITGSAIGGIVFPA